MFMVAGSISIYNGSAPAARIAVVL